MIVKVYSTRLIHNINGYALVKVILITDVKQVEVTVFLPPLIFKVTAFMELESPGDISERLQDSWSDFLRAIERLFLLGNCKVETTLLIVFLLA